MLHSDAQEMSNAPDSSLFKQSAKSEEENNLDIETTRPFPLIECDNLKPHQQAPMVQEVNEIPLEETPLASLLSKSNPESLNPTGPSSQIGLSIQDKCSEIQGIPQQVIT